MIRATLPASLTADLGHRRLRGQAVPWNVDAVVSDGTKVRFLPGSLDLSGVPVVLHHDESRPVGRVLDASDDDTGHQVVVAVSEVPDGDEALVLASDGVLTGLSVGVEPTEFSEDEGVLVVTASDPRHLAVVTVPAYPTARVSEIAAQAAEGEPTVTVETTVEAPEVVAAAPRTPPVHATARIPSPGEYLYAAVKRRDNPERFAAMQAAIQAAAPHTLFGDVDGGTFSPLIGPVVDSFAPAARPVSEAFGILAAPSGVKQFLRPSITARLDNATTAPEKTDVTDGPLVVDNAPVTMDFIKRAANVSAEALAFTTIDVLGLLANDLARAYLHGFEALTVSKLASLATGTPVTIAGDGSDAEAKIMSAAAAIYAQTYTLPDLLIMAPDVWAEFGSWKATDGRLLFPYLGPTNASGSTDGVTSFGFNVLGLRPVVTWSLPAGKAYLASREWVEVYEAGRVDMRVDEPTVLGIALGIGGAHGEWLANGKAVVPVNITP